MKFRILLHRFCAFSNTYTPSAEGKLVLTLPADVLISHPQGFDIDYAVHADAEWIKLSVRSVPQTDPRYFGINDIYFPIEKDTVCDKAAVERLVERHILPLLCFFANVPVTPDTLRLTYWEHCPDKPQDPGEERRIRRDLCNS